MKFMPQISWCLSRWARRG